MKYPVSAVVVVALFALPTIGWTNLQVEFVESAPKDWFAIKNVSGCEIVDLDVTIDLRQSVGKLIFDTTGSGAGIQVFQPFEVREGKVALVSSKRVADGDEQLTVNIMSLAPQATASFTIDVDDTVPSGALGMTMIAGAEIEGATVSLLLTDGHRSSGIFGDNSKAVIELPECTST